MTTISPALEHVAVYGTLRFGERADRLWLGSARLIGSAWASRWELRHGGPFPFALPSSDPDSRIKVDVLETDAETLSVFDRYEGFPGLYTRIRVPLVVDGAISESNPWGLVSAWIYTPSKGSLSDGFINELPRIASGDWSKRSDTSFRYRRNIT